MRWIGYFLGRAVRSMRQSPFPSVLAVVTIAIALFTVATFGTVVGELRTALRGWGRDLDVSVYLRPDLATGEVEALAARVRAEAGEGASVRVVTPEEGLAELRAGLGDHAEVLDALDENPLPAVLEVSRGPALEAASDVEGFAAAVQAFPGVDEVDWGQAWARRLERLVDLVAFAGFLLGGLILAAGAITVSNTIKLAVYARRDEIEIMKLCGATDGFVRTPFLIEGGLQGLAGAAAAGALTLALWALLAPQVQTALAEALAIRVSPELPWGALPWLLVAGLAMGLGGSALSLGRYLDV